MWLIAGLGNPGERYELTRHNAGFFVVDALQEKERFSAFKKSDSHSLVTKGTFEGNECVLLKPQTFMNVSGRSVAAILRFYHILPERLIVVHDELDLPFGAVRTKNGGGHGGHNGLRSIIEHIGAQFWRVRLGIGRPVGHSDVSSHVLSAYTNEECIELTKQVDEACLHIKNIIKQHDGQKR